MYDKKNFFHVSQLEKVHLKIRRDAADKSETAEALIALVWAT